MLNGISFLLLLALGFFLFGFGAAAVLHLKTRVAERKRASAFFV